MKNLKQISILLSFLMCLIFVCFGTFAKGWEFVGDEWYFADSTGDYVTEKIETSNGKKYYLGEDGRMVRDYLLEDYNGSMYYFNDDGEMVKNTWVAVDPLQVSDPYANGPTVYLYYFGGNGKAYKAVDTITRKIIDGKRYLFDVNGRMLSGWINENGVMYNEIDFDDDPFVGFLYYAGDETDGVLREGWMPYEDGSLDDKYYKKEVMWFYFNKNNNKKVMSEDSDSYNQKKINGKFYAFDENGVMLTGWEAERATKYHIEYDDLYNEEYGALAKKRWVYTVPSEEINQDDHVDEVERWFYADSSGDIVKGTVKKITKEYYAFDNTGILKSGLVVINGNDNTYIDTISMDETDGKKFIIDRLYTSKDTGEEKQFVDTSQKILYFLDDEMSSIYGARRTGEIPVGFSDNDYIFSSEKNGELETLKKRKFHQAGIQLRAEPQLGLGIVMDGVASTSVASVANRTAKYIDGELINGKDNEYYVYYDPNQYNDLYPHFIAVDARGNKITASNTYRKDKEGNFWMFGANGSFIKIVSVPVKYNINEGVWYFRSDFQNAKNMRVESMWQPFGTEDASGLTVSLQRGDGGYEIIPDEQYTLNFNIITE